MIKKLLNLRSLNGFILIQIGLYLLPLFALPFLARTLSGEQFGILLYMLNTSIFVGIVVDWGLIIWTVRGIAKARYSPGSIRWIMSVMLSARLLIVAACLLLALALVFFLPHAKENAALYWMSIGYGVVLGLNPTCFFQGMGQGMLRMSVLDAGSGMLVIALTFLFIRSDAYAFLYPLFLMSCKGLAYAAQYRKIFSICGRLNLSLAGGIIAIKAALFLFLGRASTLLYTQIGVIVIGYALLPASVGVYIVADKIVRAVISLANPFLLAVFPEICASSMLEPQKTARHLRLIFLIIASSMSCAALILYLSATLVIRLAFGGEAATMTMAVEALRAMCLMIPLFACNELLGVHILVARGFENALTLVRSFVGMCAVLAFFLLSQYFGLYGVIWIPAVVEGGIFCGLALCVWRNCPEVFRY